jgi:NADH-quinone oxidoreductase subunit N
MVEYPPMTAVAPIYAPNILPVLIPVITAVFIILAKVITGKVSNRIIWFLAVIGVAIAFIVEARAVWSIVTLELSVSDPALRDFIFPYGNVVISLTMLLGLLFDYRKALERKNLGTLLALVLISTSGAVAFSTATHLVILILGIEIFYLPLCTIAAFEHHDREARKSGLMYLMTGLLATGLMIFGAALYYGGSGTLSMREISVPPEGWLVFSVGSVLILASLLLKGFYLPFMAWNPQPDLHDRHPIFLMGVMAAISGTAVFLVLARIVPEVIIQGGADNVGAILLIIAVVSIFAGNFMAMAQANAKKAIACLAVAHAGYMLIGLVSLRADASAGVLFHLALFGPSIVTAIHLIPFISTGERTGELAGLIGAGYRWPVPSMILLIILLSIAGLPPTAGFAGEILIFLGAGHAGLVWSVLFALLVNIAGIFCCLRIIAYMYMKRLITPRYLPHEKSPGIPASLAFIFTGIAVLILGMAPAAFIYMAALATGFQ